MILWLGVRYVDSCVCEPSKQNRKSNSPPAAVIHRELVKRDLPNSIDRIHADVVEREFGLL